MATKTKPSPVQLTITADKQDNLLRSMGVSGTRAKQLMNISTAAFEKSKGRVSKMLLEISKDCKNPNELAVSAYVAGQSIGEARGEATLVARLVGVARKRKK